MIYGLGMQELLVILAIVMLLFGGKKLPEVGRNLGKAIRGFKHAEDETMKELKKAAEDPSTGSGQGDEAETGETDKEPDEETERLSDEATEEKETEEKKGDPSTGSGQAGAT